MEHLVRVAIIEQLLEERAALVLAVDEHQRLAGVGGPRCFAEQLQQAREALVVGGAQLDDLPDARAHHAAAAHLHS